MIRMRRGCYWLLHQKKRKSELRLLLFMFTLNSNLILNNEKKWEGGMVVGGIERWCVVLSVMYYCWFRSCLLGVLLVVVIMFVEWVRWLFIGVAWDLVVIIIQSVVSFCSWFCNYDGFVFPLWGGLLFFSWAGVALCYLILFIICCMLKIWEVFSSHSLWTHLICCFGNHYSTDEYDMKSSWDLCGSLMRLSVTF